MNNIFKREKKWQKCPRCKEKAFAVEKKCDNCGLIFERLNDASNKEAKKCLFRGEREKVVKMYGFPADSNRWICATLCAFLGWAGAHSFYVGRYLKALFSLCVSLLTCILILLLEPSVQAYIYKTWMLLPSALCFYFWFYDLALILLNKYRVPVAINKERISLIEIRKKEKRKNKNKEK